MGSWNAPAPSFLLFLSFLLFNSIPLNSSQTCGRRLLGFKETLSGSNITFECSPSGPCVPCLYSEKNIQNFHCSETGYRIPFKCEDTKGDSKETNSKKSQNSQSSKENSHNEAYITYRSCIPAVNEDKLSVLGFEGIMLGLLLISSSVVYYRRKRTVVMPGAGAVRTPTNSRF